MDVWLFCEESGGGGRSFFLAIPLTAVLALASVDPFVGGGTSHPMILVLLLVPGLIMHYLSVLNV